MPYSRVALSIAVTSSFFKSRTALTTASRSGGRVWGVTGANATMRVAARCFMAVIIARRAGVGQADFTFGAQNLLWPPASEGTMRRIARWLIGTVWWGAVAVSLLLFLLGV